MFFVNPALFDGAWRFITDREHHSRTRWRFEDGRRSFRCAFLMLSRVWFDFVQSRVLRTCEQTQPQNFRVLAFRCRPAFTGIQSYSHLLRFATTSVKADVHGWFYRGHSWGTLSSGWSLIACTTFWATVLVFFSSFTTQADPGTFDLNKLRALVSKGCVTRTQNSIQTHSYRWHNEPKSCPVTSPSGCNLFMTTFFYKLDGSMYTLTLCVPLKQFNLSLYSDCSIFFAT